MAPVLSKENNTTKVYSKNCSCICSLGPIVNLFMISSKTLVLMTIHGLLNLFVFDPPLASKARLSLVGDAAFKAGILKHVPVQCKYKDIFAKGNLAYFYIARHHFSIPLLISKKMSKQFLNKQKLSSFDSDPSAHSKGYEDKCNTVVSLLKTAANPLSPKEET